MRAIVFGMASLLVASPSLAQSVDSMQLAMDLGSVLGSEEACSLNFDQAAIASFIENKVDETDMGFAMMLQTMTQGQEYQMKDLSPSSTTAHCTQTARVAKAYGFTN